MRPRFENLTDRDIDDLNEAPAYLLPQVQKISHMKPPPRTIELVRKAEYPVKCYKREPEPEPTAERVSITLVGSFLGLPLGPLFLANEEFSVAGQNSSLPGPGRDNPKVSFCFQN